MVLELVYGYAKHMYDLNNYVYRKLDKDVSPVRMTKLLNWPTI